ncbi:hypothetical protein FOL47_001460 [Perkinsus chesapeaki]|uniref:Uncharacterized protein n=1 Tax=Perkinsus chesapeaki TaxID=330153 RepID=A0A7J6MJC5_PERCH|nr:hypothetical protein FOL47_001460 [Perkinsus chesapeaki]
MTESSSHLRFCCFPPSNRPPVPESSSNGSRVIWHGGLPYTIEDGCEHDNYSYVETDVELTPEVNVKVMEQPSRPSIAAVLWPSGRLLARAIVERLVVLPSKGRVIEIGAGVGLPSLAAAKTYPELDVTVTDRPEVLGLISANIKANNLQEHASAEGFDWSSKVHHDKIRAQHWDVVLAADVVYFEEQDPLLYALSAVAEDRPDTLVVLAYRTRTPEDLEYLQERVLSAFNVVDRFTMEEPGSGRSEILSLRWAGIQRPLVYGELRLATLASYRELSPFPPGVGTF